MKKQVKKTPIKKSVKRAKKQSRIMPANAISEAKTTQPTNDIPIFKRTLVGDNKPQKKVVAYIGNMDLSDLDKVSPAKEFLKFGFGCIVLLIIAFGLVCGFFLGLWKILELLNLG